MVFINNSSTSIQIPKHNESIEGSLVLKITNNITGMEYEWEDLVDVSESPILYEFAFLPYNTMDEGEYSYGLFVVVNENESLIESGLLVYGDYVRETSQYESDTNKIVQFDGE